MPLLVVLTLVALVLAFAAHSKASRLERRLEELSRRLESGTSKPAAPPEPRPAPAPTPAAQLQAARIAEPAGTFIAQPAAPARRPAETPAGPDDFQVAYAKLWALLTGGNPFVRIGVLVLFFGVAFLLKYASEHQKLPPQLRMTGAALLAAGLLVAGWRLRKRVPAYALVLQGGGVGMMYLTAFASLRLYQLLPAGAVFVMLCLVVAFSAMLAVLQDSVWLAVMAVLGGFLAPVLASTGQGSHVVLFSYYFVLNAGILAIALYRSWRSLNVLGFVCTFVIASAWGVLKYQPDYFASTEPFLIAFFLLYTGVALLYALRQSVRLTYYADGTLIFGVPLTAFGLQSAMVHGWEYALAYSALALALFYMLLATLIHRLQPQRLRLLAEAFLALGVGFGTLAIPFALDAYWTSAAWALEGAGILWTGLRQGRRLMLASGLLLQIAGGVAFLLQGDVHAALLRPVINSQTLGVLLIASAGLFSSWRLDRSAHGTEPEPSRAPLAMVMFAWGLLWWLHGGIDEAHRLAGYDALAFANGLLLFASVSLSLFALVARGLRWRMLGMTALGQMPVLLLGTIAALVLATHPSDDWGWLAWPAALLAGYALLRHLEDDAGIRSFLPAWHTLTLLAAVTVVTWECDWQLQSPHDAIWRLPLAGVLPALVLLALATRAAGWLPWPVARHRDAYVGWAGAALTTYLWVWLLSSNIQGDATRAMFPYIPLLDPLDAAQWLALLAMGYWLLCLRRGGPVFAAALRIPPDASIGMSGMALFAVFACINGMLIRALCYWLRLPFEWQALVDSQVVQMALSILWTSCALGLMVSATRMRLRAGWYAGAALMAVEMVKLFVVDLASAGSLERIVSFIVVGGLLLLVGYFSPLPPATAQET